MKAWMMLVLLLMTPITRGGALEELAAQYKQAGEPIEPEDFQPKGVADSDNAVLALRQAMQSFPDESDANVAFENLPEVSRPLSVEHEILLLRIALENFETIEHIDAAMKRKMVDWHIKIASPTIMTLLPHLNGARSLTNLLKTDAWLMAHLGADAQVLKDVQRILFISAATEKQGFLVGHLVSLGQIGQAVDVLEKTLPQMKVGPAPAAPPEMMKELIEALLDNRRLREGMRMALLAERMSQLDMARCIINRKLNSQRLGQMLGGRHNEVLRISSEEAEADGMILLRHSTRRLEAFSSTTDWPSFKARAPALPKEIAPTVRGHVLLKTMLPAVDGAVLQHYYRIEAERRLAAVALAVRLYAAENDGKLPATLDELVPKFLPAVPLDPMTAGEPLRYDADAAIVYSVGADGKDDGGSDVAAKAQLSAGRWQRKDAAFHLRSNAGENAR